MANTTAQVVIVYTRFPELAGQLRRQAEKLVRVTGLAIRDGYRQNAREDTGAQKASAYVVTASTSTYAQAVDAALDANPAVELLAEVQRPNAYTAYIAVAASYAAVNEFGGHSQTGDGALTRAAEALRAPFLEAMEDLLLFSGKGDVL